MEYFELNVKPPEPGSAETKAWASIPQAIRTVNISVVISLISIFIALFTLFWSVRPARVDPVMSAVFASREGGMHLSIPLSIVNTGARSTAVLAAKLIESRNGRETIWGADFTADPNRAIPAMTGAITHDNAALWVPFIVPGNGQIERVFIFRPLLDRPDNLIASGQKVSYHVVLLLSGNTEADTRTDVTWPEITDATLSKAKGGVGSMGAELENWVSKSSR